MSRINRLILVMGLLAAWILGLDPARAQAPETGTFLSVQGKVSIQKSTGESRPAKEGATVAEGEKVTTSPDGQAVIRLFDGSQISLKPGTAVILSRMRKPSEPDKVLQFKLLVGELFAKVEKLASASSSFEIQSGGVICGVRGTEFSMNYDASRDHLELHVQSGMVWAKAGGQETTFNPGDTGQFTGGQLEGVEKPVSQDPALKDLKAFFSKELLINHDNAFTDPAVGGTVLIPTGAFIPPNEAVP